MNADDKLVVFTAAEVDALRNALAETSHVGSYLHEPVRALLARLDAIPAAASDVDMFRVEASEGHAVRCVLDGQEVGCRSVVVRGVYPVPEPIMVPWVDARPGMVLVDRDADGVVTGVAQVGTVTDDDTPTGKPLAWRWAWTPWIEWDSSETWLVSDGWRIGSDSDAVRGELVGVVSDGKGLNGDAALSMLRAWAATRGERLPEGLS